MKISDNTSIAMPMRNLISIVVAVAVGVWAYFGIVERINVLETSEQLMKADLLKKAEQTPKNLEMLMLIEMNAKILEKLNAKTLEKTIVNLIKNSKLRTKLQELSLKKFKKLPIYKIISNTGPRHKPLFKASVKLHNTKIYIAEGKSKKDAEQNAAVQCLQQLKKI